jgi:Protein of unknown function (DUF2795)
MADVNPVQVQKYLKGVDYPVHKNDLLKHVHDQGGDESVRATLEKLPDKTYETPADVSEAIGQIK